MFKATVKSLLAHKLRMVLTALAVILGVAFMAGTFILTDTIKRTFDNLFTEVSAGRDVIVRGVSQFAGGRGPGAAFGGNRPLVPESVLGAVRATSGVRVADGSVQGQATLILPSGKVEQGHGPPTLVFGWVPDRQLSPLTLRAGRGPATGGEMTIDNGTAKTQHVGLGDKLTVVSNQPPRQFTVVGITGFGSADNIAGATILTVIPPAAQEMVGRPGYYTEVDVAKMPGATVDQVQTAIAKVLPTNLEAVTSASVAQQNAAAVSNFLNIFNRLLLSFAGIALFVGAFLIFNTFSILVGQRTRELALLRAVGASRGQINRSVLGEAVLVGLAGSVIGLVIALPLAAGLYGLLRGIGFSLPSSGLRLLPRTAIYSLVTGTAITGVAAILPARRASHIPPVAAMREDAIEPEASLGRRATIGGTVLGTGLLLLLGGLFLHWGLSLFGVGCLISFVGVAMLAPLVTGPMAQAIGAPLARLGATPARLAQENAARNPRRTAATASALMIGLAVVSAVATLGASAKASFGSQFDRSIKADYVVSQARGDSLPPAVEDAVRHAPGVTAASGIANASFHEGNAAKEMNGIDPKDGPGLFNMHLVTGSPDALAKGQLLVDDKVARSRHLQVGDTIQVTFAATGMSPMTVGGTFTTNQFLGSYVASEAVVGAANVSRSRIFAILLNTDRPGPAAQASLNDVVRSYGSPDVKTGTQFKNDQKQNVNRALAVVYVLLLLSILIACVGVVNTLVLSVIERRHEIGLLRAVGMHRRQTKRMIRTEAVVVSLIGAIMGLVVGIALGVAVVRAIGTADLNTIAIPWTTIVVVLILAALAGIFAAVWPARRAAKLDVLQAIATT